MKRAGKLFDKLISYANLLKAIDEVNQSHHWHKGHKPNRCTAWVEETKEERIKGLRKIIVEGFEQQGPKVSVRWDASAQKFRTIREPVQWPDQYVHHALIQVLYPILMRGMDPYCCGSIKKRGPDLARKAIQKWMRNDPKGTRYELSGDIYHFYESLKPEVVMERMRRLVKGRRVLDLIWRIIKDGIYIGAYPSQWNANATLQPLDHMIRESGLCKHYERYMDNITIFGSNKRNLRKLKAMIEKWLNEHGLKLKGDWQIFPTVREEPKEELKAPRNGVTRPKGRTPDAVGYRYGRNFVLPRKHNLIRIKRAVSRYRRKKRREQSIPPSMAASILSRLGQVKHCNNHNIYQRLFQEERIVRDLKETIRRKARKENLTWNMYLEQRRLRRSLKQRAENTQTLADTAT